MQAAARRSIRTADHRLTVFVAVFRNGEHELAVLHALGSEDEVRDALNQLRMTAQHDDLLAHVLIKVHMHGRHDVAEVLVLDGMQLFLQVVGMVIEHDG